MFSRLNRFWTEDQGQDLIEYALLMAFLAIAAVGIAACARAGLLGVGGSAGAKLASAKLTAGS